MKYKPKTKTEQIRGAYQRRSRRVRFKDNIPWADGEMQALAAEVDTWLTKVEGQLVERVIALESKGKRRRRGQEDFLAKSIRGNMYIQFGDLSRVGFSFARHGVYWYLKVSNQHPKANPRQLENSDWFSLILDANMDELDLIVKSRYADAVVKLFQVYLDKK